MSNFEWRERPADSGRLRGQPSSELLDHLSSPNYASSFSRAGAFASPQLRPVSFPSQVSNEVLSPPTAPRPLAPNSGVHPLGSGKPLRLAKNPPRPKGRRNQDRPPGSRRIWGRSNSSARSIRDGLEISSSVFSVSGGGFSFGASEVAPKTSIEAASSEGQFRFSTDLYMELYKEVVLTTQVNFNGVAQLIAWPSSPVVSEGGVPTYVRYDPSLWHCEHCPLTASTAVFSDVPINEASLAEMKANLLRAEKEYIFQEGRRGRQPTYSPIERASKRLERAIQLRAILHNDQDPVPHSLGRKRPRSNVTSTSTALPDFPKGLFSDFIPTESINILEDVDAVSSKQGSDGNMDSDEFDDLHGDPNEDEEQTSEEDDRTLDEQHSASVDPSNEEEHHDPNRDPELRWKTFHRDAYCTYRAGGVDSQLIYLLYSGSAVGKVPTPDLTCVHQLLAATNIDVVKMALGNLKFLSKWLQRNSVGGSLEKHISRTEAALKTVLEKKRPLTQKQFEFAVTPRLKALFSHSIHDVENSLIVFVIDALRSFASITLSYEEESDLEGSIGSSAENVQHTTFSHTTYISRTNYRVAETVTTHTLHVVRLKHLSDFSTLRLDDLNKKMEIINAVVQGTRSVGLLRPIIYCDPSRVSDPLSSLTSKGSIQYQLFDSIEGMPWVGSARGAFPVHFRAKCKNGCAVCDTHGWCEGNSESGLFPVWCFEVFSAQSLKQILKSVVVAVGAHFLTMEASVALPWTEPKGSLDLASLSDEFIAEKLREELLSNPAVPNNFRRVLQPLFNALTEYDLSEFQHAAKLEEARNSYDSLKVECDQFINSVREGRTSRSSYEDQMFDLRLSHLRKIVEKLECSNSGDVSSICFAAAAEVHQLFEENGMVLRWIASEPSQQKGTLVGRFLSVCGATQASWKSNLKMAEHNRWALQLFDPNLSGRLDSISFRTALSELLRSIACLTNSAEPPSMATLRRIMDDMGRTAHLKKSQASHIPYHL